MENASEESGAAGNLGHMDGIVRVRLLGGLCAEVRGAPVALPGHPQGPALLAWLALHPGEHPRGPLAALLWPQLAPSNARRALREAVWSVRRSFGPLEGAVLDRRDTVELRCETDLAAFERALDAGEQAQALALCGGALLAGAGLDAHEWVLTARAEHERRIVRTGHWKR
jgi:DNA-binding SARP family transcriptional activator